MRASGVVLLPYAPASVAAARCHLASGLRGAHVLPAAISDAVLVLSELLTNALMHASPLPGARLQLSWALAGGAVEIAVSDGGGATRPHPAHASLTAIGGRGLTIVEHLSDRWGVRTGDLGTIVWAVLPAPAVAAGRSRGERTPACLGMRSRPPTG